MITDPMFYLSAIPAVLLFGMAKGGMGGGLGMLAVPLMALVIPPVQAAAILLPLLLVMDTVAVWSFRGSLHWPSVKILVPSGIAGVLIGAFTFRFMSDDAIRLLMGAIALVFTAQYYGKLLLQNAAPAPAKDSVLKGSVWGAVGGFTSFGIHAGGPPVNIYLLPLKLEKKVLIGTFAIVFAVINLAKLPPYIWLGQFDSSVLYTALVLMPLAPIGVRLGYYLLHKVSEAFIYQISYLFLVLVGIQLMFKGFSGLLA